MTTASSKTAVYGIGNYLVRNLHLNDRSHTTGPYSTIATLASTRCNFCISLWVYGSGVRGPSHF